MAAFEIRDQLYLNGKPFKIISGGIHYFRIVPEYWRDRLEKLAALGCNTVETYIPWNIHEPEKGSYCFEGMADIKAFVKIAQELGLWVILRPSPYICAEWELGGLPGWLLGEDHMRLRGCYEPFLKHVEAYYSKLFKIISPLQITHGGPVILMQLENEYGYYGDSAAYLKALKKLMTDNGLTVPLITSDGPWGDALACGSVEDVLPTANFGSKAQEQFQVLKGHTGGGPLMCTEFWVGWFDYWGCGKHNTTSAEENASNLDYILEHGNANIYMFIGGTNFGFMNGSNYYDELTPDTTSYDYDALLTESGDITTKYEMLQKVISRHTALREISFTAQIRKKAYGTLTVKQKVGLFNTLEALAQGIDSEYPQTMEKLGQSYGYILYLSVLEKETQLEKIRLWDANDRVNLFLDGKPLITLYDRELLKEHTLGNIPCKRGTLALLAENMGRVNFGPNLERQRKGIGGAVQINGHQHFKWRQYPLLLNNLEKLDFSQGYEEGGPAFYQFEFEAEEAGDTWLDFSGWGKGCAFINGFNLGRYWEIGPQKRLYIPGPLIRKGKNEILLFETEGKAKNSISLIASPDLG